MANDVTRAGIAGIQSFTVSGAEIAPLVNTLFIYEDICKFYRTFKAIILDDALVVDDLKLVGGETVSFDVVAAGGKRYSATGQLFSIKKDNSTKNKRMLMYEMWFVDSPYVNERANLVKKSYSNVLGTDIISNIGSEFLKDNIRIPVSSLGLLFTKNPHVIDGAKPLKAIDDMRKQITFGAYPSGISTFFHDKRGMVVAPVEYLLEQAEKTVATYIEKANWGAMWTDTLTATHAIVDYTTNTDQNEQGRIHIHEIAAALKQERKVLNAKTNKTIVNQPATFVSIPKVLGTAMQQLGGSSPMIGQAGAAQFGGKHNNIKVDTDKIPLSAVRQTDREQLLRAMLDNAPQIYVKVPIQGGLDATVGAGVFLDIIPPQGARPAASYNVSELTGPALVCECTHEIHNDNLLSSTTMRCLKGGFNI